MAITTPSIPTGTICKFQQTTAPTLWTKLTSYNDYALRVTSGTVSTGGTRAFSAVFANQAPTAGGTLGAVTGVSINPAVGGTVAHQHIGVQVNLGAYVYDPAALTVPSPSVAFGTAGALPGPTTAAGGGTAHNHGITVPATYTSPSPLSASTNADFSIKYVDMILAQRN